MKRTAIIGIAALTTAALSAAQERPQEHPQSHPAQSSMAEKTFMGEIASVDETAKTITVKKAAAQAQPTTPQQPEPRPGQQAGADSMTFTLNEQTEITANAMGADDSDAEELEWDELEEGDRVAVSYVEEAGKQVARSVQVVKDSRTQ